MVRLLKTTFTVLLALSVSCGCRRMADTTEYEPSATTRRENRYPDLLPAIEKLIGSGKDINVVQPFFDPNTAFGKAMNKSALQSQYSPLHMAVYCNNVDAANLLVENGADLEVRDHTEATPLHRAVQGGLVAISTLLVESGADVNARDFADATPIYWASAKEENAAPEIFELLIKAGAHLNVVDEIGCTPLHQAVHTTPEIVEFLIKHGANVNASGRSGYTPLHAAALGADIEVLEVLLGNGANMNARDVTGRTPLGEARYHIKSGAATTTARQKKIIRFLRSKGATE